MIVKSEKRKVKSEKNAPESQHTGRKKNEFIKNVKQFLSLDIFCMI